MGGADQAERRASRLTAGGGGHNSPPPALNGTIPAFIPGFLLSYCCDCVGESPASHDRDASGEHVSQKRVLVVEDEALIRMLAVDMLLDLDMAADEAGTAQEALAQLRGTDAVYALVFMDIGLPDRHGDDLIRDIRERYPDLPLLVASGEDQAELKARLGTFSPIAFLGKPFDIAQLGEALKVLGL